MFWKKKGISPLIATVLIIGFTVALAAVIMVWGQGFIKGMQEKTEAGADVQLVCAQDVSMSVSNVCEDGVTGNLKVTVKNDGSKALKKVTLRMYESTSSIGSVDLSGSDGAGGDTQDVLAAFGVKTYTVAAARFAPMLNTVVKQSEGIPIVTIEGKDIPCTQSGSKFPIGALPATADDIPAC